MNIKHRYQILLSMLFLCLALPAFAHNGHTDVTGLQQSLLHPLMGIDHLLVLLAVGALAVQRGGRLLWLVPGLFLTGIVAGCLLMLATAPLPGVEVTMLLSVLVLGGILYFKSVNISLLVGFILLGFALFHGYAHGSEFAGNTLMGIHLVGILAGSALILFGGMSLSFLLNRLHCQSLHWSGAGISLAGLVLVMGG